ncbi:MAG: hypothetical protein ABMA02_01415 [Saprospiraceae bacterium]
MLRGGSWNNKPANVRVANRNNNGPSNRNNNMGFRLAKSTTFCPNRRVHGCPAWPDAWLSSVVCPHPDGSRDQIGSASRPPVAGSLVKAEGRAAGRGNVGFRLAKATRGG